MGPPPTPSLVRQLCASQPPKTPAPAGDSRSHFRSQSQIWPCAEASALLSSL
jgi:hypothetical protein